MTKRNFDKYFKIIVLSELQRDEKGTPDKPRRRMKYNDVIDVLYKKGEVTDKQYQTWIIPDSFLN